MGQIQISSPFLKSMTHTDITNLGTTPQKVLSMPTNIGEKRIYTLVCNTSSTISAQVWGVDPGTTPSTGIPVYSQGSLRIDNYNGELWAKSNSGTISLHIAYAKV